MFSRHNKARGALGVVFCFWLLLAFRSHSANKNSASTSTLTSTSTAGSFVQSPTPENTVPLPSPFSYVFYATNDDYACSALVNVQRLQTLFRTTARIVLLATSSVSDPFLTAFRSRNVTVFIHEAPPLADNSVEYYQDVLLKLVSFKLHHFDPSLKRILVLDADQLILRPLDDVFGFPEVDVAAPRAYWVGKEAASSTFMLVMLSERLWRRIEVAMREIKSDKYDMDLINEVLGWEMMLLPGHYAAINSHWEVSDIPTWFRDVDELLTTSAFAPNSTNATTFNEEREKASLFKMLYRVYEQASVLHFFALGKPWSYTIEQVHQEKPDAHPLFAEQFLTWRTTAAELCPGAWNRSFIERI
jgi:hypothetical protein